MKIKDRPEYASKPAPMVAAPTDTVRQAVTRMAEKNYGVVVVVDEDHKVLGLFTERDIMNRIVNERRDPDTTPLADVMTTNVRVAREDDEMLDWLRIMSNERFRRLPVVDQNDRLVSIMTQGDFVSYTWPEMFNQVMTLTRSTVSTNYPVFLILGAVLLYTIIIAGGIVAAFSI